MIKLIRSTVLFQAGGFLLQMGTLFIFAKILGAESQGILAVFKTLGQIIASFMWVGLTSAVVYFIGRDKNLLLPILKNCLKWFIIVFPLIVLCVYIAPINKIPKFNLISQYIPYLLILIFLLSLANLFQGIILSLRKYLHYNLFSFGVGVTAFAGSVLTGLVPSNYDKLTFAAMAYIASYAVMFFYGLFLTCCEGYNLDNKQKVVGLPFLKQFKVGFRGFISEVAGTLLFKIDLFIVGYFLTFKEVGIYSIALFSAEMVTKIPYWSAAILTPMVASGEEGHVNRTVYLFYSSMILAFLFGLLIILIILVFPDFISNLIGKDFKGAELCLLLLLPRVVIQSGVAILAANLAGKGYPWYHPLGCFVPIIFLLLLDIILTPRLGIYGVALGSSVAYISAIIIFWIGFKKYNSPIGVSFSSYANAVVGLLRRKYRPG